MKGGKIRSPSDLSSTPQNVRGQLSNSYRILGETKVVIQEFYIPPSYHSCIKAEKKKDIPRYSGTQQVYTFIFSMPKLAS